MRRGERRSDGDRGRFGVGVLLASLLPEGCAKSIRAVAAKARSENAADRYSMVLLFIAR